MLAILPGGYKRSFAAPSRFSPVLEQEQMDHGVLPTILEILARIGGIPNIAPDQDFYDAGLSSVSALPLLLELEERFGLSIPDERFIAARTAVDLEKLLDELRQDK